ncbi:endonuclease/exonuclease/phosphatase family protein [Phenylobacterium sp. J426]|uniref:endonuclease/exonuclease/phosphatase family protein n=1 Tax=Phenylobacterium sp. J426 TaxID=2898439 RepID=UPI0021518567|nr:endonuclease/exonuclease/phosphatase family protein [Phenylobacterium sp. J426]MCR5875930.1 endonuclease/exonuclease/phosphatase family protein [Phenylobacterium sp. J426]
MRALRVVLTVLLAPPLFLGGALCAGAAAAAHMGRESLRFDILTHFAPLWLAGGLLALAGGLAFRGYVRALILGMGATAVLCAGALMVPEFLRDTGPKAPTDAPGQLKLVQMNVWSRNADLQSALDWAFSEDPDIIVLEETTPALRERVAAQPGWHASCPTCEVMILSKRAPLQTGQVRLRGPHPGPLTRAMFRDERGAFAVIGVHYAWPTDSSDQQAQEAGLAQVIAMSPRERTIVAGDFNSTPWSFSRRRWDAEFGLIRRDRALFSWPAQQYKRLRWLGAFPFLPIDHVYAGSDWATVKVKRGPRLGSDHYPVVMTLAPVSPR